MNIVNKSDQTYYSDGAARPAQEVLGSISARPTITVAEIIADRDRIVFIRCWVPAGACTIARDVSEYNLIK